MTPLLLTAWTIAVAQDTPARETPDSEGESETPLAIPIDEAHAPVPGAPTGQPAESDRPLAIPGRGNAPHSAARLQALKQYQRERIAVGTEVQFHASGPPVGFGFGDAVIMELLEEQKLAPETSAGGDVVAFAPATRDGARRFGLGGGHVLRKCRAARAAGRVEFPHRIE